MKTNEVIWVDPRILQENKVTKGIYSVKPENLQTIIENIQEMGILEPLLVDTDNVVISGNIRLRAALELNLDLVPVIYSNRNNKNPKLVAVSHAQQRIKTYSEILMEYEILQAEYPVGQGRRTDLNPEMKKNQQKIKNLNISKSKINKLQNIKKLSKELFDEKSDEYRKLWETIDSKEISLDKKLKNLKKRKEEADNRLTVPETRELITEKAKIFNKSCESMTELEDESIDCIITSPPYFQMRDYGIGANQRGLESDVESYIAGLVNDMNDCKRVLKNDGSLWVNLGEAVIDGQYNAIPHRFVMAMMNAGWIFNDEIVWVKNNAFFTTAKRCVRAHEYIFHFVKSGNFYYDDSWLTSINDTQNSISFGTNATVAKLISTLDFRGNILRTNGNNMDELRKNCKIAGFNLTHSAAFPLIIPLIPILTTSRVGGTILDIYNGTATTGEAALLVGRNYVGYEVKPEYIMGSEVRLKKYLEELFENESIAA